MEQPRISVLINNFNYARYLRAAVASAVEQVYPDFEVVVADDRSTDRSLEILAEFGDAIRLVETPENGGQAHSVNHGFAACTGEWIAMLDADDLFLPGKLAAVAERAATALPGTRMIYDRVQQITAEGTLWGPPIPIGLADGDITAKAARRGGVWDCPPMSGLVFRREFLEQILPQPALPHRVSFDHYLANLAALTAPVAALDEPWSLRRLHGRNKYKHPDRMARRRWTLVDDMRRIERMAWFINDGLRQLGSPVRVSPENKLWYTTVRYWAGEVGFPTVARHWIAKPPDPSPLRIFGGLRHAWQQRQRIVRRGGS